MNAVASNEVAAQVFYSHNVGITFSNTDPIVKNPALVDMMSQVSEESKTVTADHTTIAVDTHALGYFLHMLYCSSPENTTVNLSMDGIYPFDADDEQGVKQRFNAQMATISEVPC